MGGTNLILSRSCWNENGNASPLHKTPGQGRDLQSPEGAGWIGGNKADEATAICQKPSRQIVDLVSQLGGSLHHLLACVGSNACSWREGSRDGRTGNARALCHHMGTHEVRPRLLGP